MKTFNEYAKNRKAISQLCAYFEQILDIAKKITNLIAADRNGGWEAHLQAVQELIPICAECDSIHYFRYGSYNTSTEQIYNQQVAEQYTNFSKNSISRYQNFRHD